VIIQVLIPFAAAGVEPDKVQLWPQLFCLSMIAVLCVAYIVAQLGNTRGGLRFFHVLCPPRRPRITPWGISVIAPVLLIFLLMPTLPYWIITQVFPGPLDFLQHDTAAIENVPTDDEIDIEIFKPLTQEELAEQHPLTILIQKSGRNPLVILVCFLTAVIVAPLSEELVFRVVMQCGIESTLRRELGHTAWGRLPVLVTAMFFASIHFRLPTQPEIDQQYIDQLFKMMTATMIGNLITVAVVIVIFRSFYRIRWSDVGLWEGAALLRPATVRRIGRDALGALFLFLMIIIPVRIVNVAVGTFAKSDWAAARGISASMVDPIPLFLFALVIGTLYYRTRRFASVFFLHAFFNLFGFLFLMYLTFRIN